MAEAVATSWAAEAEGNSEVVGTSWEAGAGETSWAAVAAVTSGAAAAEATETSPGGEASRPGDVDPHEAGEGHRAEATTRRGDEVAWLPLEDTLEDLPRVGDHQCGVAWPCAVVVTA